MLNYLCTNMSKVAERIMPHGGVDCLKKDISSYSIDEDVGLLADNLSYQEYWKAVAGMKEGEWPKYDVLPRFALALGAFFNSNSEVERAFSVQTDIHRDPKKNRMNQDSLDAHMNIRFGVESKLSYNELQCATCQSNRKRPHCHCSISAITEDMVDKFDGAYKKDDDQDDQDDLNCDITADGVIKFKDLEKKRMEKVKDEMVKTKAFYRVMDPIYERKMKDKSGKNKNGNNLNESSSTISLKKKETSSLTSTNKKKSKKTNHSLKSSSKSLMQDKESSSSKSLKKKELSSSNTTKNKNESSSMTLKRLQSSSTMKSLNALGKRPAASPLLGYTIPKKTKKMTPVISSDSSDSE